MLERIFQINKELEGSIFLFGGRQTGKTTVLRQQFPDTTFFDLLDTNVRRRLYVMDFFHRLWTDGIYFSV